LPGDGDDIYIVQQGTYAVTVDCVLATMADAHLTLGGAPGSQTLHCDTGLGMPIVVEPSGVLEIDQGGVQGPVTNRGTILLRSAGATLSSPWLENQAGAVVDFQSDGLLHPGVINNAGTLRKSGGTNATTLVGVQAALINSGWVDVQTGTLYFDDIGMLSSDGTINIRSGAVLLLAGSTATNHFDPANQFTGGGICSLKYGIVDGMLKGTPLFRIENSVTFAVRLETGTMLWNYGPGTLSGALTIGSNAVLNVGSTFTLQGVITNWGRILWPAGGGSSWRWEDGARLENQPGGVFDLQFDGSFGSESGTQMVNNAGTFLKSGGTNTASISQGFAFANRGLIDLQSGTLRSFGLTNAGTVNLADGTTLEMGKGTFVFDPACTATGTGCWWASGYGGMATISGPLQGTPSFRISGPVTFDSQLNTIMSWTNGALYGALTVSPNGVLNLANGPKSLYGVVTNSGRINWVASGWSWTSYNGAWLENQSGGLIDIQADGNLYTGEGLATFNNAGIFRKSGGTGKLTFNSGFAFANQGSLEALSGTIKFAGPFTQSAGATLLAGGNLESVLGLNFNGGGLSGAGTVTGNITNTGAVISPGSGVGLLALTGNYWQGSLGALNMELGGRNTGLFDELKVSAIARLGGKLSVALLNGFAPASGDQFPILTGSSLSGAFTTLNVPAGLSVRYSPTNVLLVATGAVALQITGPVLSGGHLAFSFGTISGQSYTVQRNDDLAGTNWILETNFTGTGALLQFATPITNAPRRFFRVREP
jgi:hypothetical protein